MEKNYNPPKKAKLVIRSASPVLKIVLCLFIVLSMAALVALRWVHNAITGETQKLTQEAAAVEHANQDLEDRIGSLDSVQSVQDIAREELDLVDPDTVLIDPN